MWTTEKWDIKGHQGRSVPNEFYRRTDGSSYLALVFPGMGYSAQGPLLFYTAELLFQMGYDVLVVTYSYSTDAAYLERTKPEREHWFREDMAAVFSVAAAKTQYCEWTLVGKSLGTEAMLHLLESGQPTPSLRLVWMTPGNSHSVICSRMRSCQKPTLFLVGTSDHLYDATDYQSLRSNPNITVELFEGADHALEVPEDVDVSMGILQRCISSLRGFLPDRRPTSRKE
jgi:predicted alpha/beta-hydrolase family hydrolase